MQLRYQYRVYPTPGQRSSAARGSGTDAWSGTTRSHRSSP
ncbi:helix-turn-helix domain-containing protein [Streptomyces sp. NPDC006430]